MRPSVLFIDGHDSERYIQWLKPNYVVFRSTSAKTGLDLYESQPVDCVVLELDLPDTSGFEVLSRLIPVASRPEVAVVVLTRLGNPHLLDLAISQGAKCALHKPTTTTDTLDRAVHNAIATVKNDKNQAGLDEGFPLLG
jgi:DNA-binding NarL/FixJ family response regulator